MKKYYYPFLFLGLTLLYVLTIYNYFKIKRIYERKEVLYTKQINDLKSVKALFNAENQLNFESTYRFGNKYISDDIKLYRGKNEKYSLEDINKNPKLVYRISDNVCEICYDNVLAQLIEFESKNQNENNIIILVPLDRIRELKVYLTKNDLNIPYYGIKEDTLGIGVSKFHPYFFILENNIAQHIFVPSKNEIKSTEKYLDIIWTRYFS